ncbi:PPE family protein PPE28 [Mycobacterium tuberculosis H37Rv] [Mycobacterium shimoidei]|uniref:PPE family protein PPE28 [Mycobacterium tuberculosis H37Rv] n=1 Tax=Mycobacterium shimoidei TaxID=29313 RepID=A0A375YWD6_MYCSH|nr:PE-PPE domain-containing protein [Mycobacterium shimoidei]SRX93055.1 PPE family protein PPE28 [Mycobacterium tuberculosis H37Rv] [Mycobacterium shimoidei]
MTFARISTIGMIAAAIAAPTAQVVYADLALTSTNGPLLGSETAIILGGTTEPTPSVDFARTAEELYLNPLGFNGGSTDSIVCYMDGTDPCSAPLQVLTTPELIQQGPSSLTAASDIVLAVRNQFDANPGAFDAEHPLTIFGYSQSATAESIAMSRLAELGIPTDSLHFVFIGDPSTPDGIWQHLESAMDQTLGSEFTDWILNTFQMNEVLGSLTPNDLYPATIYDLPSDPVSNFVDVFEEKGLFGAMLDILWPHVWYLGLTPDQIADATITTDGALTYVDIDETGINGLQAWLDAVFFGGAANSGLLDSLFDSLQLLFTGSYAL